LATDQFKREEVFHVLVNIDKFQRNPFNFYDSFGDLKLKMVHEIDENLKVACPKFH